VSSSGSFHGGKSNAFEMVRFMHHSHTLALVLISNKKLKNIKILIRAKAYDCGAKNGPFRKHQFAHCEDSLMMATMEYRNM
jgi:hypothetical protein